MVLPKAIKEKKVDQAFRETQENGENTENLVIQDNMETMELLVLK
jgi:hypothetical protein